MGPHWYMRVYRGYIMAVGMDPNLESLYHQYVSCKNWRPILPTSLKEGQRGGAQLGPYSEPQNQ